MIQRVTRNCPRCGMDYMSDDPSARICLHCRAPRKRTPAIFTKTLSFREKQVVGLVSKAKVNKEIAAELHLSVGSVKVYVSRIFRKVEVSSRIELALWALRNEPVNKEA